MIDYLEAMEEKI